MTEFKSTPLRDARMRYAEPRPVRASGILHFTIGVTDLERSRAFYESVLGCHFWRQNATTVFMTCGKDYFVLSKSPRFTSPNDCDDTLFHHAFIVRPEEFESAVAYVESRGIEILRNEDEGHRSFPGRHAYFHDPDGNGIELIDYTGPGRGGSGEDGERAGKRQSHTGRRLMA
jgi:catechol 2,3-dioxygenase-like lactoylglutathione lyase family enzyme